MDTTTPNSNTNSASSTSATPNLTQSPIFLLSNIYNLITTRLDSSNYVAWKFQISSILKVHSLIGYIDGTHPCPSKFIQDERGVGTAQINPDYQIWNTQNQALMTLLNATLSQTALLYVIGYSTSIEAWLALERRFSASTRSNILQLKSALHNISKAYNTGYDSSLTNPNYWYTDTRATNHITDDLANLNFLVEYQGDDNITIANGQALDISYSSQSSIQANDHTFRLNSVLCVPS
ncbi:hypothetical protein F0562_019696 [Nyssa sinensis]|uniref:Retrotransposon Copia-like N-terminal domain-containing protein n=1 Tax=Nyssa sinensis TaxID=561372 RepID=A0A5J5BPV7_9ASTE|nr:hypothetical protein F0562_019696 [Nyssa sinensis]